METAKAYIDQMLRVGGEFHSVLAASGPMGVFGALGASEQTMFNGAHGLGGLRFTARILPFNKGGERSVRPVRMTVDISLNPRDLVDIRVVQERSGTLHYAGEDFFMDQLESVVLALDYDGVEPLNPRLV